MRARISQKGIAGQKVVTIAPWSHNDSVKYDAGARRIFREEHGLSDKFVVMYSGNHSPCHPLQTLLQAANRLRDRKDIAFCFVGGGSEMRTVCSFAKSRGLDNIVTLPYQPIEELSASLSAADLHVVVMGEPFVGIVHPCKVYNIRTLGIPYLYIGPAESHVGELDPTFAAEHGDVAAVVRQVVQGAGSGVSSVAVMGGPRRQSRDDKAHSHDQLVTKMLLTLERTPARHAGNAALAPTMPVRRLGARLRTSRNPGLGL